MEFIIDHNLLNEIGIDAEIRIKKFRKNQRKAQSLFMRMEKYPGLKDLLKIKVGKNRLISDKEFFYNLFNQNKTLAELIDIILYISKTINYKLAREIYEKEFSIKEQEIPKILFNSYLNPQKDIFRKIHYKNYLDTQKHIEANRKRGNFPNIPNNTSDSEIQTLLRGCSYLKQRKKIKVWYVLPTDQGIAIFIYVDARTRKRIPSTIKKRNQFIKYSKPNIIYLRNNGKKLLIYSRDIHRNIKYASAIFYEKSSKTTPFEPIFDIKELKSSTIDVNNFILKIIKNEDELLTLEDLSFYPDKARHQGILMSLKRESGLLVEIINLIKRSFPDAFNLISIQEITFSYEGFQFTLNFWGVGEDIIINYNYRGRDPELGQRLVSYLKEKYSINLNKKVR